jgi:hypothetical protein
MLASSVAAIAAADPARAKAAVGAEKAALAETVDEAVAVSASGSAVKKEAGRRKKA